MSAQRTAAALMVLCLGGCASTVEPEPAAPVVTPTPPPTPPAPRTKAAVAPVPTPAPKLDAEAPPEPQRPAPVVAQRPSDVEWLIAEFQRLRRLSAPDVAREQELSRQALAQSRSDTARVRYAMALSLPGMPPADESRALEMLEPIVRNGSSTLNGLAVLLSAYIQEQRRLGTQVLALQQKLEALRALERNLSERRR